MAGVELTHLYTAAQSRAVDRCAIEEHGLPGPLLMARAARAALERILVRWPRPSLLQILCGPGNNGGDGLLLAVLAVGRGLPVRVFLVDGEPRSEDGRLAADKARAAGIALAPFDAEQLRPEGVLVDAMLGTGIRGAPRPVYRAAIAAANALPVARCSLDLPSGVDSDTGAVELAAIRADLTISFITGKRGLYTGDGPAYAGERHLDDLDVPTTAFDAAGPAVELPSLASLREALAPRAPGAHKGHCGRCLLIGGDHGMGGAVMLAAEAALRSGVGLLRVATREAHIAPLLTRTPEAMATPLRGRPDLEALLPWADVLVLGPGLGEGPWGEQLLQAVLAAGKPLVLDADALNLLARDAGWRLGVNVVITPHPGEAARLLGISTRQVQADRFAALEALAGRVDGAVILKGIGSLVSGTPPMLCSAGNPGMASGGMGDVLSGVVGALLAQGLTATRAARLATRVHSEAADRVVATTGERGLLASDLAPVIGRLLS